MIAFNPRQLALLQPAAAPPAYAAAAYTAAQRLNKTSTRAIGQL